MLPALFALGTLFAARHPPPTPAEALINATTESATLLADHQPRALSWAQRALIGVPCVHGVAGALACASNPHLEHLAGFLDIVPLVALICTVPGLIDAAGSATRLLRLLLDSVLLAAALLFFCWYLLPSGTLPAPTTLAAGELLAALCAPLYLCLLLTNAEHRHAPAAAAALALALTLLLIDATPGSPLDAAHTGANLAYALLAWLLRRPTAVGAAAPQATAEAYLQTSTPLQVTTPLLLPLPLGLVLADAARVHAQYLPAAVLGVAAIAMVLIARTVLLGVEQRRYVLALHAVQRGQLQANQTLQTAYQRLHTLATTDPLTGTLNHRATRELAELELLRAQRFERTCAVIFFDLDHFKQVNDTYGHAAGDSVLCLRGRRRAPTQLLARRGHLSAAWTHDHPTHRCRGRCDVSRKAWRQKSLRDGNP